MFSFRSSMIGWKMVIGNARMFPSRGVWSESSLVPSHRFTYPDGQNIDCQRESWDRQVRIQRGGGGGSAAPPPSVGKSQVIWVS